MPRRGLQSLLSPRPAQLELERRPVGNIRLPTDPRGQLPLSRIVRGEIFFDRLASEGIAEVARAGHVRPQTGQSGDMIK